MDAALHGGKHRRRVLCQGNFVAHDGEGTVQGAQPGHVDGAEADYLGALVCAAG